MVLVQQGNLDVLPYFFVACAVLGPVAAVFFYGNRNGKLKRRVLPWWMAFCGLLFSTFAVILVGNFAILLFVVPVVLFILTLSYRMTNICRSCGAFHINNNWFQDFRFCPKCGRPFNDDNASDGLNES